MAHIQIPDGDGIERRRMWALSPEVGAGVSALGNAVYTQTTLPIRAREAARMRIASINDCHI